MIAPLVLAASLDIWNPIALGYNPGRAQQSVATIDDVTLRDAGRGRSLPLEIVYPVGMTGSVPVIIFSHGAGGTKDTYERVLSYWASFGYVVIAPSHPDGIASYQPGTPVGQWLRATLGGVAKNPNEWIERPRDISFIINSLAKIEQYEPVLKGHLDTARIGVAGHSYGAQTTMLIGGATIHLPGSPALRSAADLRVSAIVAMSPQGTGTLGFTSDSWKSVKIPAMILTGSRDIMQTGQTPATRKEPFDGEPAGNKYFVSIDGANHFSFTGAPMLGPNEDPILTEIDAMSLAFWDAYLKNSPAALAYLAAGPITTAAYPEITFGRK